MCERIYMENIHDDLYVSGKLFHFVYLIFFFFFFFLQSIQVDRHKCNCYTIILNYVTLKLRTTVENEMTKTPYYFRTYIYEYMSVCARA